MLFAGLHLPWDDGKEPRTVCLLFDGVEVVADLFVHAKHVHLGLLKDGLHLFITANLPFVVRVLEIIGLYVLPQALDDMRTGQLGRQCQYNLSHKYRDSPRNRRLEHGP